MRRRTLFLWLFGIFSLGLSAAEWVVRLRAHARYGEYLDIYDFHEPIEELNLLIPSPRLSIEFAGRSLIETDSHGFRSPELKRPKPARSLRIAFLGGSTTFCSQVASNAHTWPHQLVERLRPELASLELEYLNAGVTGYRTTHSARNLRARVAPLEPDLVFIYHGTNDLAVDSKQLAMAAGLAQPNEADWLSEHSLLWKLVQKNRHWVASQAAGQSEQDKWPIDLASLGATFRSNLTQLVREAQESAKLVALITFSAKVRHGQSRASQLENLAQSFSFMPYLTPEDILSGYDAYNRIIEEVAAETGALLLPAASAIPPDAEHFADSVHLTDRGCEVLAAHLHAALMGSEEVQKLVKELASK